MDWTLEVVVLPVSDIERATEFYRDKVGFHLDHDTKNEHMHVVQLTPDGSGCSIVFGTSPRNARWSPAR
jgi:catechol 2,3-dioxygenase-like lactoylglutathione lyase family enzyme